MNTASATSALVRKVSAMNEFNLFINDTIVQVSKYFAPHVGKKIATANGCFIKKISPTLPGRNGMGDEEPYFYVTVSRYSLILNFRMTFYIDHNTIHLTDDVYIGEMSSVGDLTSLHDTSTRLRKTDYDADQITATRVKIREAKLSIDKLQYSLCGFGEVDRF